MQSSSVILVCGSRVISSTQAYLTRGMINTMAITLLDDAGTALDITDVSTWDLGITEDFFGSTGVLAGSSTITAASSVLSVTINGHTDELTALMDGKNSIQAYATLRGRDAESVIKRLYVFPVVILNIGFTNDTILTTAAQELIYTKAQIDYLLSQIPGAANAEVTTNKTQEIDTETPSADKYPSEAALVAYGSGKVDKVDGKVLSDNNYSTAEKNKLESALTSVPDASESVKGILMLASASEAAAGLDTSKAIVSATLKTELDKKESTANKAVDFSTVNDVKFPTVKAVKDFAQNETLTELTGADVTVAPWTQSKWSASGVCSLTATGWAESGVQTSEILITLAAGSTPSVIGAAVSDNDVLSAAGVYSCFIRNEDGVVRFKIAGFTEAT